MNNNPHFRDIINIAYRHNLTIKKIRSSPPDHTGYFMEVFEIYVPNRIVDRSIPGEIEVLEVLDVDAILATKYRGNRHNVTWW